MIKIKTTTGAPTYYTFASAIRIIGMAGTEITLGRPQRQQARPTFTLYRGLNMIPAYDGTQEKLAFLIKSRKARREYEPPSEPWLINALASDPEGRATEAYKSRLSHYDSLDVLLTDLERQYGAYEGAETILVELRVIQQKSNERATCF